MFYFPILEELADLFRRQILWIDIHLLYSTEELKWEANYWYENHTSRLSNWHSFKDIEMLYPEERWRRLKLDIVMAWVRTGLIALAVVGLNILVVRLRY